MSTENAAYSPEYIKRTEQCEYILAQQYFAGSDTRQLSADYKIRVNRYEERSAGVTASVTEVIDCNEKMVYEIKNTDSSGEFFELMEHQDGKLYLLFKRDLYGYSVLALPLLQEAHYFPKEVMDGEEAFIWTEVHYNKNNIAAVGGCFWAYPHSVLLADLSDPMQIPARQIDLAEKINNDAYDDIDFEVWNGDDLILQCYNSERNETEKVIIREEEYMAWL